MKLTSLSEMTNRQDIGRGRYDLPAGSRGAVTKNNSGAAISYPPLPHGGIYASGSVLESPDPFDAGFHKFSLIERALLVFSAAIAFSIGTFLLLFVSF